MTTITEYDLIHKRTFSMWQECGMQFRSNLVVEGGSVPLHVHSYDHVAAIHGEFTMHTQSPDGVAETRLANRKETILAGWKHSFEYLGKDVGEVLCFWPIGHDGRST
jgi:hypothetical protein